MKSVHRRCLEPLAQFVVERKPGVGYDVVSEEGRYAAEWKSRASDVMDILGHPDPNGPSEVFRLVGPLDISRDNVYACVRVKRLASGEVRFQQAWYQIPLPTTSFLTPFRLLLLLVIFTGGLFAGWMFFATDAPVDRITQPENHKTTRKEWQIRTTKPSSERHLAELRKVVSSSRDLLLRLETYLSQEGFAADTTKAVVEEKRSVKLIADLDKSPPPRESIQLSNLEVARLLKLLAVLDEWSDPTKPASR